MKVSLTISVLAAALATPLAWAAAAPAVRPLSPTPGFQPWHSGGDYDVWGRRHRHDFVGAFGPIVGEASEPGPESAPSPFVVSAPVFVNVTFAPAAGPQPGWTEGPKLIEIGQSAPPRRRLPLVVYGD
jgi:hypothetical protein